MVDSEGLEPPGPLGPRSTGESATSYGLPVQKRNTCFT